MPNETPTAPLPYWSDMRWTFALICLYGIIAFAYDTPRLIAS